MRSFNRTSRSSDSHRCARSLGRVGGNIVRAVCWLVSLCGLWGGSLSQCAVADDVPVRKIAGIVTEYRRGSHADVILTRLLETETLDGEGGRYPFQLVSVFADQLPENDLSQPFSEKYGFRHSSTIADALTLGTDQLAVDGVLMIAEHGRYPDSDTGQKMYPKRRLFGEIAAVMERTGRSVPVFSDKHLADNTADAVWFFETAQRQKIPLMAGTSIIGTWRKPAVDVDRNQPLSQILVLSYGPLDAYGYHGVELLQALAERRRGGETGIAQVRCLSGDAFWDADPQDTFDPQLLATAMQQLSIPSRRAHLPLREQVREPVAFIIDYRDGLRGVVLTLNGAVAQWAAAWKTTSDAAPQGLLVDLQEHRPFMHFGHLLHNLTPFLQTGQPTWPVERTLFSSVILDAALVSRRDGGRLVPTPDLASRSYQSTWNWQQPNDTGRDKSP